MYEVLQYNLTYGVLSNPPRQVTSWKPCYFNAQILQIKNFSLVLGSLTFFKHLWDPDIALWAHPQNSCYKMDAAGGRVSPIMSAAAYLQAHNEDV